MGQNTPLIQRLHDEGIPFRCSAENFHRTKADSASVLTVKATIASPDGASERGVALFAGCQHPVIVLDREAAERIADELDVILAAQDASERTEH